MDSTTLLDLIESSQAQKEVTANNLFDAASPATAYGRHAEACAGLTWGYYGTRYGGTPVANGTNVCGASTTTYMVAALVGGAVSFATSTTNWNDSANYARCYKIDTGTDTVTSYEDHRFGPGGTMGPGTAGAGGGGTELRGLTFTSDTGSTADSDPGNGLFKWNNATEASATFLYFDNQTADGISLTTFFASLGSSGFVYLQQEDDDTKWQLWKWTGALTAGSGYYKFPVALQANGGTIADNKVVFCDFSGLGGGGVSSVAASGGVQTTTGSPITSTGTVQAANVINAQTGTSYALLAADRGKHVTLSNAASIAATIAQAGTTGFEDGWFSFVECIGVGAATITPTTSTINGAAALVLDSGMSAILFSDGANYRAIVIERAGVAINAQTGTSYTYLSGDRNKLVTHTNAASIAGTLPQATGAFGAGWFTFVQNRGAGTLTITPTTSTIDGAASLVLTTGLGVLIASDGTNYFTMRGMATSTGVTIGKHAIPITAGAMRPSVTGGCAVLTAIASAANQPDIVTLDFDTTTQEYAQFSIAMPKSWNEGTVTFQAIWSHPATTTNFGVVWDLQAIALSDDDAIAQAFGTAQTSTDTGGTTNDLYISPESSAITIAGTPATGDVVFFRLSRVTGNGSDTMAVDARLHGIVLFITTDAENDA